MRGLVLTNFYTMKKEIIFFYLLIFLFAYTSTENILYIAYPIFISSCLPFTTLAHDEYSKWNYYAKMMPCSHSDFILSKYVFGYTNITMTSIITLFLQISIGILKHQPLVGQVYLMIAIVTVISTIFLSLGLPIMFAFGAENGRLLLFLTPIPLLGFSAILKEQLLSRISDVFNSIELIVIILILVGLAINLLSILLSTKIYKFKQSKA